jgi:hypothetical protein
MKVHLGWCVSVQGKGGHFDPHFALQLLAKRGGVSYNVPIFGFWETPFEVIWIIHVQATWLVNPSTLIVDQRWHWQVVVTFNRATKLNIQAMFRGGLLCSHSFGGKSYYIAIFPGGGIPLYSHFSGV